MKRPHFALPEIYGEPLSFYEILTKLCQLLNEETLDRKEADATLQQNIDTEVSAREAGDTALRNALTTETTARERADTTLQQNIDTEVSAREAGDTALRNALTTETTARERADTTLQQNINTEVSARETGDTALRNDLTTETTARERADTTLQQNIDTEVSAREAGDTALRNALTTETTARENGDQVITNNVGVINGNLNELLSSLFTVIPNGNIVPEGTTLIKGDFVRLKNEDGTHTVLQVTADEITSGTQIQEGVNADSISFPLLAFLNYPIRELEYTTIKLMDGIAYDNGYNQNATNNYSVDDMLWFRGIKNHTTELYLCYATKSISAGAKLEIGVNIEIVTVSDMIQMIKSRLINLIDMERTARKNADTALQDDIDNNYATLNNKIPVVYNIKSTDAPLFINAKTIHFGNDLIIAFDAEHNEMYFNTTGSMIEKTDWTKITGIQVS